MKKKKIIFFMPFIGGGGVEKNLILISNYVSKKLDNIYICTSSKKYKKKFNSKIKFLTPKKNLSNNISIKLHYLYCLFLLFFFILKNKNSIVFCFQANVYCVLLCKFLNIKVIVRSNSSPSGWYHNFIKQFIYKSIIKRADKVLTNSEIFRKQMDKNFNIKSICIYNPLNKKEILRKSKEKINFNFFNSKRVLKIINIGRFTDQKDQITILKSAEILKKMNLKFQILLVGRGIEKDSLDNFIIEKNLKNNVKIINFQENPYKFINKSDLFVLSSKYEGLPNVLLEAAVLKKFIISSDCPTGPKEILLNGKGGFLFKIGNYKDLAKKIIEYKKNKKKLKKKINITFQNLNRFDYKLNIEKYLNLINSYI
tara:strand:- start:716 stop:1819 length:1104 start_codon:yes stop_codon:yes gene_type:complete